ncbi:hypothetical protein [Flavobacterium sp. M31R6]|uniref:hypothetical protein n=1 Tax=Flavobacterium sp. M31R6 TaxID=2739062 RepID=UPI00156850BF|nr:hypothetical protein [Flavobacterium sp. M31R6]QKJ64974.1 hypothetical protein HQN62_18160 [Flavobacterium sp. M31R6]
MNTSEIILKFENNIQTLSINLIAIDFTTTIVRNHGIINNQSHLFSIKHEQLNTVLDLTEITPFQLIYFNENKEFIGGSFSLGSPEHLFSIQTTAKHILLIPYKEKIELDKLLNFSFN